MIFLVVPGLFLAGLLSAVYSDSAWNNEQDGSISTSDASRLLATASRAWEGAEKKLPLIQGSLTDQASQMKGGVSELVFGGNLEFRQNSTGAVINMNVSVPRVQNKILVHNSQYFAIVEPTADVDRFELVFLDWKKHVVDPPVQHAYWTYTEAPQRYANPCVFQSGSPGIKELIQHSTFEITGARLEKGVLTVDFDVHFEESKQRGGPEYDILGGRLVLAESVSWFPLTVEINRGSAENGISEHMEMTLDYQESGKPESNGFPLLSRKTVRTIGGKDVHLGTSARKNWDTDFLMQTEMQLSFAEKPPPDSEFRLSAFGLPEPVRPVSVASAWWRWGGGLLVVGIAFAVIAMKLGRKK